MNQSGRMEKTRQALEGGYAASFAVTAALAEVEEWETRLAEAEATAISLTLGFDSRLEAAEAERDLLQRALNSMDSHAVRLMSEAIAEADRLKAALAPVQEYLRKHYFLDEIHDEDEPLVVMLTAAEIRAALAPADRNTT